MRNILAFLNIRNNCLITILSSCRTAIFFFFIKEIIRTEPTRVLTAMRRTVSLKRSCTCVVSMCRVKGVSKSDVCRQRVYVLNVKWLTLTLSNR